VYNNPWLSGSRQLSHRRREFFILQACPVNEPVVFAILNISIGLFMQEWLAGGLISLVSFGSRDRSIITAKG
jgi:hypothetical protein